MKKINVFYLLFIIFISGCFSFRKKDENSNEYNVNTYTPLFLTNTPTNTITYTPTNTPTNVLIIEIDDKNINKEYEMNNEEYFQKIDSTLLALNGKIADIKNDLSLVKNMQNEVSVIKEMINTFENKFIASSTIEISSLETQITGISNKIESFIRFGEQNFSDLKAENVHGNQISNIYNSNGFIIGGFSIITILLMSFLLYLSIKNKRLERKVEIINRDLNNKVRMIEERKINC